MKINTNGYYKPAVLLALYKAAHYEGQSFIRTPVNFFTSVVSTTTSLKAAEQYLELHQGRIDYISLSGGLQKKLAIDLATDELDLTIYIREHGAHAVKTALKMLEAAPCPDLVHMIGYFMA